MVTEFVLTKEAILRMFDIASIYPNPEGTGGERPKGPFDPIGPVAGRYNRFYAVALNPQPLPPREGPHPEPWRSAVLAQAIIEEAQMRYLYGAMLSDGHTNGLMNNAASLISEAVDWWCGTPPPKWPFPWPFPWPPPWRSELVQPEELVIAAVQFQKAAQFDGPLAGEFGAAADRLLEIGLEQMR